MPTTPTPADRPAEGLRADAEQADLRAELAKVLRWHKEDGATIERLLAERTELIRQRDQIAMDTVKALPAPADRAALCICGHPEGGHFEDVCQTCDCGDYIEPQDAAAVIDRWRQAALKGRAAALREAAEHLVARANQDTERGAGVLWAAAELRRLAAEAQQPTPDVAETADCGCGTYMRCPNGHCSRHYTCQDCGRCCTCECSGQPAAPAAAKEQQ